MATTRHGQKGIGVRPYAGFSPKTPSSGPKSSATVTRLLSIGIGGRRRKAGKGDGPFTRLTTMAINGRRVIFEAKNPIIPPVELVVTRLLTFGIGGKRVSFEPKAPASTGPTSGGTTKKARYGKQKKKWTEEELKGLEDYGKARLGITDTIVAPETEVAPETIDAPDEFIAPIESEIFILEPEPVSIQEIIEDEEEIGLILALIENHLS